MKPTIHFTLRTDRPANDGSAPVYIRITFTRTKIMMLALGKCIPLRKEHTHLKAEDIKQMSSHDRYRLYYWDKDKERTVRGFRNMESLNLYLDDEKKRANDIIYELQRKNLLSPEVFKKEFFRKTPAVSFLNYCLKEINLRSGEYSRETRRTYRSVITKLNEYKPGVCLNDITYKLLTEYENYMLTPKEKGGKGNNANTVENNMKIIRTFICIAVKNGDLAKEDYPFSDYKIKESPKYFSTRDFLEPDEIITLERLYNNYREVEKPIEQLSNQQWADREKMGMLSPGEYRTLQAFLIGVYTGLRFRDVIALDREQHIFSKHVLNPKTGETKLKYYIEMDLHKTGVNAIIPLIDKALKIIDLRNKGIICKQISNTKANKHLKDIQRKAVIEKRLTFHVSRHSFATVAFEYDIPEKIVQSILGHRNKKFTEIYTHLSGKKLFFEMDKLNQGYHNSEQAFGKTIQRTSQPATELLSRLEKLDENKLKEVADFLAFISS